MTKEETMRESIEARRAELQREFEFGQQKLQEAELQVVELRQKLLQISGAMMVLDELLGQETTEEPSTNDREPAAVADN
jgi:hypothetical protein